MMETERPEVWEFVVGGLLLIVSLAAGWHLVTHPEAHTIYAWGFVGAIALAGLWMVAPVRARALWHEIRASLPFLADPPPDDGHGHG